MSKCVSLAALLRRVSRLAEQMFDKRGNIDPMWLVENAGGEQHVVATPVIAEGALAGSDKKDAIAAYLREYFAQHDVVRFAFAAESWTVSDPAIGRDVTAEQFGLRYAAMGYTLANHPDRREIVWLEAEDSTETLTALREIIRSIHRKPCLGALGKIERANHMVGRWTGLLPSVAHDAALRERPPAAEPRRVRLSSELPDDVGIVFVTAVPNAPLQILGRRDPVTGELCVGSTILPKVDHAEKLATAALAGVEVVTGPEAERLILALHGWYTEQAERQGKTLEQFLADRTAAEPNTRQG